MAEPAVCPLRITFVALTYAPATGGAQELVRRLAEALAAEGHHVRVVTTDLVSAPASPTSERIAVRREQLGGVAVERCRVAPAAVWSQRRARAVAAAIDRRVRLRRTAVGWPWLSGPWSPSFARSVRRARRRDDIVVACSAPFLSFLLPPTGPGGAEVIGMPLLHDEPGGPRRAVARALRRCDRVVAVTEFEADLARAVGVAPERLRVIPPGTDPARFLERTPADARRSAGLPERPTVGFIGRLAAYKGVDTFLEAAAVLWERRPDLGVLVAGAPTVWEGHRDPAVRALGGDRYVVREGFAPEELPVLAEACDVIVHPSREESFGLAALDAWAARRPVVLADLGCVRSFAHDGVDAVLVPAGDAPALAEAVLGLLDDDDARTAMGRAGRRAVEERFTWHLAASAWADLVSETAGGR